MLRVGTELREARLAAGLSLRVTAAAAGMSKSALSRLERGQASAVSIRTLQRVASVVGFEMWLRLYPGPDALRDAGQASLEGGFRDLLGPGLRVAAEVPVGDARDLRAWDLVISGADGVRAGVELDTRLTDAQSYLRRVSLKRRDGDVDRVILVLADTRSNRAAVQAMQAMIEGTFASGREATQDAITALAMGRVPESDVVLLVKPRRQPSRPA